MDKIERTILKDLGLTSVVYWEHSKSTCTYISNITVILWDYCDTVGLPNDVKLLKSSYMIAPAY